MLRRLVLALLTALSAVELPAQTDTTGVGVSTEPLFTSRDAWMAGGFVAGTMLLFPFDRKAAERLQDERTQENRFFRHQATNVRLVAESAYLIGGSLYAVGRLTGNRDMADLGLHGTEAIVVGMTVTSLAKGILGRARPLVDTTNPSDFELMRGFAKEEYRSFPSGHTLTAFAAASAVTAETARWWPKQQLLIGTAMYGGATLVGLSRMYNNKHWASDVMMGAAIGTFAGRKIVRYHHSHPDNRIDKWLLGAGVAPDGVGGTMLTFSLTPPR